MPEYNGIIRSQGISGTLISRESVDGQIGGGGGSGWTYDHSILLNRDNDDQHPIKAITGLNDALEEKMPSSVYDPNEIGTDIFAYADAKNRLFIAEYQQTSFEEIQDAVGGNMSVKMFVSSGADTFVYDLVYIGDDGCEFGCSYDDGMKIVELSSGDEWQTRTDAMELLNNKVQSISSSSTSSQYPSARAVFDYIASKGYGTVASVNGNGPDQNGNVQLDAEDVSAIPISYGLHHENLIMNPWFTVNQRGIQTYTQGSHCADRWKIMQIQNGSIGVSESSGITINGAGWGDPFIQQTFENYIGIRGKKVTFSINVQSVQGRGIFVQLFRENTAQSPAADFSITTPGMHHVTFTVPDTPGSTFEYAVRIIAQTEASTQDRSQTTIRAVKLELGEVQTLGQDAPPDYETELLKCRRFYYAYSLPANSIVPIATGRYDSSTQLMFQIVTPVCMRTTPQVNWSMMPVVIPPNFQQYSPEQIQVVSYTPDVGVLTFRLNGLQQQTAGTIATVCSQAGTSYFMFTLTADL